MKKSIFIKAFIIVAFVIFTIPASAQQDLFQLPKEFVYAKEMIPTLRSDMRYYSSNNFIGKPIDGYIKPKCILTKEAAVALKKCTRRIRQIRFWSINL